MLGRVSSVAWFISIAGLPLSYALTAPVAALIGAQGTFIAAGVLCAGESCSVVPAMNPAMLNELLGALPTDLLGRPMALADGRPFRANPASGEHTRAAVLSVRAWARKCTQGAAA